MIFDIGEIESRIGYSFKDKMLLRKCFTHSSYANEHSAEDNELLEFFGDAVIEFIVTEYLYKNSAGDEGKLTVKRSGVVSREPLLKAVQDLGLSSFVLLGKGQEKSAHLDEKLFSSVYEALVAGIYLDGGMTAAKKFVKDTIIKDFDFKERAERRSRNCQSKNEFQEYVQKNKLGSVSYQTLSKTGPDHMPEFRVAALLNGCALAEGKGATKRLAEAEAAAEALRRLARDKRRVDEREKIIEKTNVKIVGKGDGKVKKTTQSKPKSGRKAAEQVNGTDGKVKNEF
ncbi:MAG: ribonuclease III [Clostridia bacterium]|nr:ribonuclease III [Clostridia bacterium]